MDNYRVDIKLLIIINNQIHIHERHQRLHTYQDLTWRMYPHPEGSCGNSESAAKLGPFIHSLTFPKFFSLLFFTPLSIYTEISAKP